MIPPPSLRLTSRKTAPGTQPLRLLTPLRLCSSYLKRKDHPAGLLHEKRLPAVLHPPATAAAAAGKAAAAAAAVYPKFSTHIST